MLVLLIILIFLNTVLLGWRVDCNPPSVLMWHLANRATRASGRLLINVFSPFPLAGRPFHRFTSSILNNLACLIGNCWMDVSFLLRSQGSRLTPLQALQLYMWAEFPQTSRRGSKATHQLANPNIISVTRSNKNFGNLILTQSNFIV